MGETRAEIERLIKEKGIDLDWLTMDYNIPVTCCITISFLVDPVCFPQDAGTEFVCERRALQEYIKHETAKDHNMKRYRRSIRHPLTRRLVGPDEYENLMSRPDVLDAILAWVRGQ